MTLNEAIKHCEQVAAEKCDACGEEHRQLAEWLRELAMAPTREEMLSLAERETFLLDDRLKPYSRKELRSWAWLEGYYFAKRHQQQREAEEEERQCVMAPPRPRTKRNTGSSRCPRKSRKGRYLKTTTMR